MKASIQFRPRREANLNFRISGYNEKGGVIGYAGVRMRKRMMMCIIGRMCSGEMQT